MCLACVGRAAGELHTVGTLLYEVEMLCYEDIYEGVLCPKQSPRRPAECFASLTVNTLGVFATE